MATKKQLKELQGLMDELVVRMGELGSEAGEELADEAGDRIEQMRAQMNELMGAARERGRAAMERARETGRQADKYVHDNPWQVAAGAVVLGVAIGYLISASQRSGR